MTKRIIFAAGVLTALLASPGNAREGAATTRVPLFNRTLSFTLPAGMAVVNNRNNGTNVLIEYVPKGETLATWTRLVTIQAYRGLGASPMSTAALARQAFYPAACKIGPIWRDGGERAVGGGLKRTLVANGCASLPAGAYPKALKGAGEQDFILIFRDAETVYTLNYAVRGAPFKGKAPPVAAERGEVLLSEVFGEVLLTQAR